MSNDKMTRGPLTWQEAEGIARSMRLDRGSRPAYDYLAWRRTGYYEPHITHRVLSECHGIILRAIGENQHIGSVADKLEAYARKQPGYTAPVTFTNQEAGQ